MNAAIPTRAGALAVLAALALAAPACMKPNPLVEELAEDDGTDAEDEAADTEDDATDDGADEGAEPLPDFPANDGEGVCGEALELDEACDACLADACCAPAYACGLDADCACLADCLLSGGTTGSCNNACGVNGAKVETLAPLLACAKDSCPNSC